MEIIENTPIVIFDNRCFLCIKFAKFVDFFARGKITMIGHYTKVGEEIREKILDESAREMFWFIDKKVAFGGRAALLPLAKMVFSGKLKKKFNSKIREECQQECKTVKAVFVRSSSLLTNSKKIEF